VTMKQKLDKIGHLSGGELSVTLYEVIGRCEIIRSKCGTPLEARDVRWAEDDYVALDTLYADEYTPNYATDRKAMQIFESKHGNLLGDSWLSALELVVLKDRCAQPSSGNDDLRRLCKATPRERAEAFILAVEDEELTSKIYSW
jgi:hypothetical protein